MVTPSAAIATPVAAARANIPAARAQPTKGIARSAPEGKEAGAEDFVLFLPRDPVADPPRGGTGPGYRPRLARAPVSVSRRQPRAPLDPPLLAAGADRVDGHHRFRDRRQVHVAA